MIVEGVEDDKDDGVSMKNCKQDDNKKAVDLKHGSTSFETDRSGQTRTRSSRGWRSFRDSFTPLTESGEQRRKEQRQAG